MTGVPLEPLILTSVPLGLVSLHPDYSTMLFRRFVIIKTYNISHWYKKFVCIYASCVKRTELLVGQAGKSSTCVFDIIWGEHKRNNIAIDKDMLLFYIISKCLNEQREMYGSLNSQLSTMCFQPVVEEMHVNNFNRLFAYLAFVYRLNDSCEEETIQEAVRRTVEAFRLVDLEKYKRVRVLRPQIIIVDIPFKIVRNRNDKNVHVITKSETKNYRVVDNKRVIVNEFDALPYGLKCLN